MAKDPEVIEHGEAITRVETQLDQLERFMLSAWLVDAAKNVAMAHEYMRANEQRFSEDLFDELGRLSEKLQLWASQTRNGERVEV